jgi:hypothetical protein
MQDHPNYAQSKCCAEYEIIDQGSYQTAQTGRGWIAKWLDYPTTYNLLAGYGFGSAGEDYVREDKFTSRLS